MSPSASLYVHSIFLICSKITSFYSVDVYLCSQAPKSNAKSDHIFSVNLQVDAADGTSIESTADALLQQPIGTVSQSNALGMNRPQSSHFPSPLRLVPRATQTKTFLYSVLAVSVLDPAASTSFDTLLASVREARGAAPGKSPSQTVDTEAHGHNEDGVSSFTSELAKLLTSFGQILRQTHAVVGDSNRPTLVSLLQTLVFRPDAGVR